LAADPPLPQLPIGQVAGFRVTGAQIEPGEACLTSAPRIAARRPSDPGLRLGPVTSGEA
jgi:hypothetical protein